MQGSVWRVVEEFVARVKDSGYRGLLVVSSGNLVDALVKLYSVISRHHDSCLLMASSGVRSSFEGECEKAGPPDLQRILGREYDTALIAVEGLLRPNIIAGVAETVRGGGILAILTPEPSQWNPGPPGGLGSYREYLVGRIMDAPVVLWVDVDSDRVIIERQPTGKASRRSGSGARARIPRALLEACATGDQVKAVELVATHLRRRARSLMITGDRGRGKSYAVGLGLALAIHWHMLGRAVVVGPSPWSVASLMEGLVRGLRILGHEGEYRVTEASSGAVVRVSGPWYRVSYEPPETAEPAALTVIDEAGAVGVARVRRISWKSSKVIVATTLQGYEGSGRAFAHLVEDILPKPIQHVELEEPIRYPRGDPLEEWLYDTFALRPEPPAKAPSPIGAVYRRLDALALARNHRLLAGIARLLATAHYRNEPDDLLVLLESPNHTIHVLESSEGVVAAADVALEEEGMDEAARIASAKLTLYAGESPARAARVVRIAVHPELQRRGLGTRLLSKVEEWARGEGCDLVLTIFSRHDVIGFWLRNGYKPYYISPRYNRVTGEKNIAMGKPLTARGERILVTASRALRLRLLLSSSSIYRDLAAEKLAVLIPATEALDNPPIGLTGEQSARLRRYLTEELDYEQASDAVFAAVASCLARRDPPFSQGAREWVAVVARILQGKPLDEVARILGVGGEEAKGYVDRGVKALLEACGLDYE